MANRDDLEIGVNRDAIGSRDWANEEAYWRGNFTTRPYVTGDRDFEYYRPGYRYGFETANRMRGREWSDAEPELRAGWDRYEGRGQSAWENVKDAVRDAWHRVAGR